MFEFEKANGYHLLLALLQLGISLKWAIVDSALKYHVLRWAKKLKNTKF